ncbi:hypothetical protein Plhal304r1_c014g0052331 [Plasmopara halstedii]
MNVNHLLNYERCQGRMTLPRTTLKNFLGNGDSSVFYRESRRAATLASVNLRMHILSFAISRNVLKPTRFRVVLLLWHSTLIVHRGG